jgi:hypothetical protein
MPIRWISAAPNDQHAGRGAHADGGENDREHHAHNDPGIVDAPGQQPGDTARPHRLLHRVLPTT